MAGYFDVVGGAVRGNLAALDGLTGAANGWDPAIGDGPGTFGGGISAILPTPGRVYLGGAFTSVGGQVRNGFAIVQP